MPRIKKSLNKQGQWMLLLLGGLAFIYLGFHWQDLRLVGSAHNAEVASSTTLAVSPVTLEIPALHISAPVIYSTATKESSIQDELESGVVHLSGTADPGDVGNAYIVGHSSNYKNAPGSYNEVFKDLPNIQVGDEILVTQGKRHMKFVVYETRVVEPTELWVMSQETSGAKIITLQTSYPVGTAKQRFVALGRLTP